MATKSYSINKGINRPIEFRGLKAQYIGYLAACVVGSLVGFGVLHACGISLYVCTPLTLGLGGWMVARVFRMSKRYGQYGLMKKSARKQLPKALLSRSRKMFIHLYRDYVWTAK
ncbi:DUF4133 domain-containing protein [Flavitalea sp. BT771]|uniref:DUF4133 domain-containing protein n=1 Tax=Flavitalea sp. BT771 TaxID=3063329 RepID=UPI0026E30295|nr:DUF4133 domain-containing protein [Flavitalea sp. BT771]MDO6431562.1 DUF4133 domain-containing protein [Flavitalea sp. BT771]MDV6220470.1 DUF4133 domain-containing protein [Flavitalea sp. BT771]